MIKRQQLAYKMDAVAAHHAGMHAAVSWANRRMDLGSWPSHLSFNATALPSRACRQVPRQNRDTPFNACARHCGAIGVVLQAYRWM